MKYILIVIAIIFGVQSSSFAQRGHKGKLGHLKAELELSDAQVDELKTVLEELRNDKETAEDQDRRAAMNEAIQGVLTEEQLVKFEALENNRGGRKGHKGKAGKHGDKFRKGLSKDEETLERLKEMRTELDESITADDKLLIDDLRTSLTDFKGKSKKDRGAYKELSDEEKKALKEARKVKREELKAEKEKLKVLVDNYKSEIESLFEQNKEFFEDKKSERKEEFKERRKERKEERKDRDDAKEDSGENRKGKMSRSKKDRKGHAMHGKRHMPKHAGFLLMDPDMKGENATEIIEELNSISVFPNPASSATNVTYVVKEGGQVRVEIRDESGRIYEVITNEVLEAGTYTKSIETSKYQDKTYYISITDGKSIKTEKLLIQK